MERKTTLNKNQNDISIWRQRIGYGVSDLACNLIWQVISLYLLYFYTDVMRLDAAAIGLMFVVIRIVDGGTDLLAGYIIDRTNTRWGKSRPYFLFGAIPFALFAFLAFNVPDVSQTGKLVYAYVTYFGLSLAYTFVNVPMASILPSLTKDANERTALSTSRKFFGFLGATIVSSSALPLVNYIGQGNQAKGFSVLMLIFGVVSLGLFIFTFFNVREINNYVTEKSTFKEIMMSLKENKPWLIFALNILFMWSSFFLQSSALIFYYTVVVGSVSLSVSVATLMSFVPMIVNFAVPFLAKRMGKRNLYISSAFLQLVGIVIIWLAETSNAGILIGAVISAAGYGLKESIYFSMQADPVDYGEWKTGVNATGSISAINGFLGKVAQALAGGISGILLAWGAYDASASVQPDSAVFAIESMYLYLPAIFITLSIITMFFYRLDEIYPEIKEELEEIKQKE